MEFLYKGILIGIIFGIPVGTVGTMTIQRTLSYGIRIGIITGLGSSMADCLYALVGVFGITVISDFLLRYETVINIVGGSFMLSMGITMFLKKDKKVKNSLSIGAARTFLPSFLVAITNPVTILTFLFAFTYFEIPSDMRLSGGFFLVCGVFIGTLFWWSLLSVMTAYIKNKKKSDGFRNQNKVFGIFYILFGVVVFIRIFTRK